ncbi:endoplasmic reticulum oxidoreductin, putative [Hepatocystis sp. ex Piliocolobus tephrosceles]|nr:endoplasmic reticulum oxidoreductin, putative [Hepatocystis sp. ex Piliocolobus tephrosceles]
MKLIILCFFSPIILFSLLLQSNQFTTLNVVRDKINEKVNNVLLYFNIFDIKFPESYINNEKILGVHVQDIENDARTIYPILKELIQKYYFRIFKVNLHVSCKFKNVNERCHEKKKCSVCECEDEDIPINFRTNEIDIIEDKLLSEEDLKKAFIENNLYKDILGIYDTNDEGFLTYVDLVYNSPAYTAYDGKEIWQLIYEQNCFQNTHENCKEMDKFYKILSGMQANIATLSSEYFYLKNDYVFGDKYPDAMLKNDYYKKKNYNYNITFFQEKIGLFPDRIENLYFTFAILLRALCRLKFLFKLCKCNSGFSDNDKEAVKILGDLLSNNYHSCSSETFLKPLFPTKWKDILSKFAMITNILDCVPCVKCRLHGKLKTTALQIALVEGVSYEHIRSLERNEITALINAIYYFADSILIINNHIFPNFYIKKKKKTKDKLKLK